MLPVPYSKYLCQTVSAYHVVFKAEDTVINIKLCQFFFVDADLVLLLDLHYPGLNLLPCCIRDFRLQKIRHRRLEHMQSQKFCGQNNTSVTL